MKLHSSLTTVTPISKFLAMLLFVTLPFAGFYLGMQYGKRSSIHTIYLSNNNSALTTVKPLPTLTQSALTKDYKNNTLSLKYPTDGSVMISEKAWNYAIGAPTKAVIISSPYQEPWEKVYTFSVQEEENSRQLTSDQILSDVAKNYDQQPGPEGKGVATKIRSTKKVYNNNEVMGVSASFGWDSNPLVVIMTKGNSIFTFQMTGDQGVASAYDIKLFDQILSTVHFL